MQITPFNAPDAPQAAGGYSQAIEITGTNRLVFVSGQIPVAADGSVPTGFEDQARLVWRNVELQLRATGMALENIIKVTTFLSERRYRDASRAIRQEVMGDLAPALTVIICDIFDDAWLLEIEAIAAD